MITAIHYGSSRRTFFEYQQHAKMTAWASGAENWLVFGMVPSCQLFRLPRWFLFFFFFFWHSLGSDQQRPRPTTTRRRLFYDLFLYNNNICIDTRLIGMARSRWIDDGSMVEEFAEESNDDLTRTFQKDMED